MNLFADFFKFFNVVFSIKIPGNPQNLFVNNETFQKQISEKDYLFSMIIVNIYQPVPK